jgi:dipeptidyl aminopeptidase/acylaminoacyl peptidase
VILFIHGGPNAASLLNFSAASQAMAGRGYIVFSPNYRGSDNFGNTYYRAVVKNAGDGPGRDVMAGLAVLKQRPYVDSTRIFVSGTSYGGYMTSWLIGHFGGWKAAVAGAAVTDLADEYNFGDGNVGWSYFTGGSPWTVEGEKLTREQSPITYVRNMKTPTLITSTTGDVRVPVTQSYKLFRALSDLGVETKFIGYPVGGHGPGDPVRLTNWYDRWLEWIEQHDTKPVP